MAADNDPNVADTITSKPDTTVPEQSRRPVAERYERRGLIARGGQAEVYVAFDHELAREVAARQQGARLGRGDAAGAQDHQRAP